MRLLLKIFFTFALTALLLVVGLMIVFRSVTGEHEIPPVAEKNIVAYLDFLTTKVNRDLSPAGQSAVEEELGLRVRVEGFDQAAGDLPSFTELEARDVAVSPRFRAGRAAGYFFVSPVTAGPRIAWFARAEHLPRRWFFPFAGVVTFVLVIFVFSFLTIRWIMRPVFLILEGLRRIAAGDLRTRITAAQGRGMVPVARRFNEIAERLERMITAKERLLRDVSHELRSPLTRMNVAVDLLRDEMLRAELKADLQRMEKLVAEILESYRLKEGGASLRRERASLAEVINGVVGDYVDSKPRVRFESSGDSEIDLDRMQIERLARNLIENALKYSGPEASEVQVRVVREGERVVLRVRDDGVGIAAKDREQVFDPFFRADTARAGHAEGFGLGLSIAKAIVEAHGGTMEVVSPVPPPEAPGGGAARGTEFIARFP